MQSEATGVSLQLVLALLSLAVGVAIFSYVMIRLTLEHRAKRRAADEDEGLEQKNDATGA